MLIKYMNPGTMLAKAKKKKDIKNSIIMLIVTSVIFAVSGALSSAGSAALVTMGVNPLSVALTIFGLVLGGGLFFGWVVTLTANTMGEKGSFYEGLTSVTFSLFYLSFGFLISGIFALVQNPIVSALAPFASVVVFGCIGYVTLFRSVKEFFGTDLLEAFIIVTVVFGVTMLVVCLMAFGGMMINPGSLFSGTENMMG